MAKSLLVLLDANYFVTIHAFFQSIETSFIVHVDSRNKMWPYYDIVPYSAQWWVCSILLTWMANLVYFVRVSLMFKIIYLTQKALFSTNIYLKPLFIINCVSHKNFPGLLQKSQITCVFEELWENSGKSKSIFLIVIKGIRPNLQCFPHIFIIAIF